MLWLVTEIVLCLFLKGCYLDFIFWTTKLCHNSWKLIYLLSCFDFSEMRVGWNQVIIQVFYSVLKCITILTVLFCLFCVWGKLHCILWGRQGDDPVTFWTRRHWLLRARRRGSGEVMTTVHVTTCCIGGLGPEPEPSKGPGSLGSCTCCPPRTGFSVSLKMFKRRVYQNIPLGITFYISPTFLL